MDAVICVGDSNLDEVVTIDELLKGVIGLLGSATVPHSVDANGDGQASVDELVMAVGYAVRGCPPARFVPTACEVSPPPGQDPNRVRCGFLIVPEYRPNRNGRTLEIATIVVPATGDDPAPDPVVYVDGGPGWKTLDATVPIHTQQVLAPLLAHRDVVYFDARGVGRSRPALDCPEYDAAVLASFGRDQDAAADATDKRAANSACHDRLVAAGIDLNAFTSTAIAHDIDDLLVALGFEQYNLLGTSYGARIALTGLRDVPERVRSVTMDIPVPVEAHVVADGARNAEASLDIVIGACDADPTCSTAHPDLKQTIFAVADQVDAAPLMLSVMDPSGNAVPFVLNGDRFLAMVAGFVASPDTAALLPMFVDEVGAGGGGLTNLAVSLYASPAPVSWGVQNSLACYEIVPFMTPEVIAAANVGVAEPLVQLFDVSTHFAVDACPEWITAVPPPIEHEPVHSDVPALVLAGEIDPTTPPRYGEQIAAALAHGQFVELPATGHFIIDAGGCGMELAAAFFDDPMAPVDTACIADIPPIQF